jgi:hypothetical protein
VTPLLYDPTAFFDCQYLTGRDVSKRFSLAAGPTDLYYIGLFIFSQPEVKALIVVRVVT